MDLSGSIDPRGGERRQELATAFGDGDAGDLLVTSDYGPRVPLPEPRALQADGAMIDDVEQQLAVRQPRVVAHWEPRHDGAVEIGGHRDRWA